MERSIARRWVVGHVVGMLGITLLGFPIYPVSSAPDFPLSWGWYIQNAVLLGTRFGIAQALALRGLPFPASTMSWSGVTMAAFGLGYLGGSQAQAAIEGALRPLLHLGGFGYPAAEHLGFAAYVLSMAAVVAAAQGFLLRRRVGRKEALVWATSVFVVWTVVIALMDIPFWFMPVDKAMVWPFPYRWMKTLSEVAVEAGLFSLLTIPALKRLLAVGRFPLPEEPQGGAAPPRHPSVSKER